MVYKVTYQTDTRTEQQEAIMAMSPAAALELLIYKSMPYAERVDILSIEPLTEPRDAA